MAGCVSDGIAANGATPMIGVLTYEKDAGPWFPVAMFV
jgi:hypothetical protein